MILKITKVYLILMSSTIYKSFVLNYKYGNLSNRDQFLNSNLIDYTYKTVFLQKLHQQFISAFDIFQQIGDTSKKSIIVSILNRNECQVKCRDQTKSVQFEVSNDILEKSYKN